MAHDEEHIEKLRRIVHDAPELQARLFGYEMPGEFLAAVRELADSSGLAPAAEELQQAMNSAKRYWLERNVPW